MTQLSVQLGDDVDATDALKFCAVTLRDAQWVGDSEIRLGRARVDVWAEPDDDPGELHVAIHEVNRQSMAAVGSLLLHLTQQYSCIRWVLED